METKAETKAADVYFVDLCARVIKELDDRKLAICFDDDIETGPSEERALLPIYLVREGIKCYLPILFDFVDLLQKCAQTIRIPVPAGHRLVSAKVDISVARLLRHCLNQRGDDQYINRFELLPPPLPPPPLRGGIQGGAGAARSLLAPIDPWPGARGVHDDDPTFARGLPAAIRNPELFQWLSVLCGSMLYFARMLDQAFIDDDQKASVVDLRPYGRILHSLLTKMVILIECSGRPSDARVAARLLSASCQLEALPKEGRYCVTHRVDHAILLKEKYGYRLLRVPLLDPLALRLGQPPDGLAVYASPALIERFTSDARKSLEQGARSLFLFRAPELEFPSPFLNDWRAKLEVAWVDCEWLSGHALGTVNRLRMLILEYVC